MDATASPGSRVKKFCIKRNHSLAGALGARGTPAFVIGDALISGAVDLPTLKEAVAAARKGN